MSPHPLEFIAERLLAHSGAIQVTTAADRLSRRSSATDEGAEPPPAAEEPSAPVDETGGADADTTPADRASRRSSAADPESASFVRRRSSRRETTQTNEEASFALVAPPSEYVVRRHAVIRLFVSSTFDDMRAERNELQAVVFPKVRA